MFVCFIGEVEIKVERDNVFNIEVTFFFMVWNNYINHEKNLKSCYFPNAVHVNKLTLVKRKAFLYMEFPLKPKSSLQM